MTKRIGAMSSTDREYVLADFMDLETGEIVAEKVPIIIPANKDGMRDMRKFLHQYGVCETDELLVKQLGLPEDYQLVPPYEPGHAHHTLKAWRMATFKSVQLRAEKNQRFDRSPAAKTHYKQRREHAKKAYLNAFSENLTGSARERYLKRREKLRSELASGGLFDDPSV